MVSLKELGINGVIDAHTHSGGVDLYNMYCGRMPFVQSVDDLVYKAEMAGVEKVITFPFPSTGYYDTRKLIETGEIYSSGLQDFPYQIENEILIKSCEPYKNKIIPFLCIDPNRKQKEQLELLDKYWNKGKFFGIKLHTLATNSVATDILLSDFADFIEKNDIPLIIHCGIIDKFSHPNNIIELSKSLSSTRICIAHLARLDENVIEKVAANKNLFTDCSSWLQICDFVKEKSCEFSLNNRINISSVSESLLNYYKILKDHLIWGTDEPWTNYIDKKINHNSSHNYSEEITVLSELYKLSPEAVLMITKNNTEKFIIG